MQLHKVLGLTGLMFGLAAAVACSDEGGESGSSTGTGSGTGTGTGTSSGTATGTGTGSGTGTGTGTGSGISCTPPSPPHEGTPYNVGLVTAHVLTLGGGPAADIPTDVCGTNICLTSFSDGNGNVSVDGNGQELSDVRLLYGNGREHAKMAARLPNGDSGDFGDIHTIELPGFGAGAAMSPGSDAVQGGVTLSIPADATLKHDITVYTDAAEQVFRSVVLDPSQYTFPAVDGSLGLEVLIATAPVDSTICPAATLTFPNDAGWAADAEVEVFIHGTKTFLHYAPYGDWQLVSEAVVSSDGLTVSTKPGEGIEMLGLFGARLK